ncbi:MAG: lipid A deacylase LpxR family protein [Gammaproteobacteria bacterium]
MSRRARTLIALAAAVPAAACPADDGALRRAWTTSIAFENDLFGESDAQYTNGIQLGWVSPDLSEYRDSDRLPQWSHRIIERLPFINEPGLQRNVAFTIGQKIFTPDDTQSTAVVADDRPYAGWLYFGAAFHNKNVRRLDTFEIDVGMVGPASLAEQSQRFVHGLRGFDNPRGWDHQLDNEPAVLLVYERKHRLPPLEFGPRFAADAIAHGGAALGNVQTYVNAGLEVRVGWNLPADFGTALIRPGGETSSPADPGDPRLGESPPFSLHAFAALDGRLVGHDIFLDGNTFASSHSVDRRLLVGDFWVGVAMTIGPAKLTYSQAFRTSEFYGQRRYHEFGSVSLSLTF